jgi:hypothetical protein
MELGLDNLVANEWDKGGRSIDQGKFHLGTASLVGYNVEELRHADST